MPRLRLLVAATVAMAAVARAEPSDEVARLRAENQALRARVAALEGEVSELRILAGIEAAPGREADAGRRVAAEFDARRGTTTVSGQQSRLEVVDGARGRHWMLLRYEYPGREAPAAIDAVALEVEASLAQEVYADAVALTLVVDGERIDCPVVAHRATPVTVGSAQRPVGAREVVVVGVPRATLARVGSAREVRGELGPTRFRLSPEQIVEFRVFQRRLES